MHEIDFAFTQEGLRIFIPIVFGLIGFIIFWFVQNSTSLKIKFTKRFGNDLGYTYLIFSTRVLGALSMGLLPFLIYYYFFPETKLHEIGIGYHPETFVWTILFSLGLGTIMAIAAFRNAKKPENLDQYPQIRAKKWTNKTVFLNLLSWAIYLLGYEFFFRGLLLFPIYHELGLWPAIAINIALYSGTHLPKGLTETIGAIPFSIILCLLTLLTGSIWIAFFVHICMSWTNAIYSLKHHPEMEWIKK